jgi:hypothetical protein
MFRKRPILVQRTRQRVTAHKFHPSVECGIPQAPGPAASLLAAVLLFRVPNGAGPHTKSSLPLSTEEHVQSPGWWPTKGTAARADFVGTAECAKCHEQIAAT